MLSFGKLPISRLVHDNDFATHVGWQFRLTSAGDLHAQKDTNFGLFGL